MLLWVVQNQLEYVETTFKIEARGHALKLEWRKYGTNLKDDRNYSATDTNTLNIRHVKKSDAGCYRCLVKNEIKKNRISVCKFRIICCVDTVMKL